MSQDVDIRTMKCNIKSIMDHTYDYKFLYKIIERANDMIFLCSHFIRLYILAKYDSGGDIPEINKQLIMASFKALSKKSRGPKNKNPLLKDLNSFYKDTFVKLIHKSYDKTDDINDYKISAVNLSYILGAEADNMLITYKNNIKLNYEKYVRQFVNQNFKKRYKNKTNFTLTKEDRSDLYLIKNDIFRDDMKSNKKYHKWLKSMKQNIVPTIKKDLSHDLKHYPNKFLKCMLYMNKYLEKNKLKTFQPISLRSDLKDKYVTINTNALVDILPTLENKLYYFKNITKLQRDIWNQVFDLKKIKREGYSFNYQISTDGHVVSISLINNDHVAVKKAKTIRRNRARDKAKNSIKGLTDKQIKDYHKKVKANKIDKSSKSKDLFKEQLKQKKERVNKLSKAERDKIKLEEKIKSNEFNYIEDLIKTDGFLKQLKKDHKNNKIGYIDPGKRSPVMIMRNDGKFYEYRTRRRLKETRRLKYNELIDSKRKKTFIDDKSIKDLESELTEYSKKSVNIKTFNEYIKRKINMKRMIRNEKSYNEYLKKLNWYQYINTQRHTDKIVNEIKEFMGDGSTLIVGDWSGKGKISYISTPNVGFQRRLKRDFKVYHINEYNTSKIHHKTKEVMENLQIKTKNGFKKLHSVLTFKKGLRGMGCINRDKNAVKNMKIITESLIKTKKRPLEYSRNSNSSTHSQVGLKMRSHSDLKLPQLKIKPKIKSKKKKSVKDFVKVIKIE